MNDGWTAFAAVQPFFFCAAKVQQIVYRSDMIDGDVSEACLVRKLDFTDRAALRDHYLRLDAEAMRMRSAQRSPRRGCRPKSTGVSPLGGLWGGGFALGNRYLEGPAFRLFPYGAPLGGQCVRPLLHGCFIDGCLRAVAELCQDGPFSRQQGEAAFSVEAPWRHHGIATELFRRTVRSARNRGLRTLMISCLAWNRPMRALAAKFEAELKIDEGSVIGTIVAPAPSSFSLFEEWSQDTRAHLAGLASSLTRLIPATR